MPLLVSTETVASLPPALQTLYACLSIGICYSAVYLHRTPFYVLPSDYLADPAGGSLDRRTAWALGAAVGYLVGK